MIIYDEDQEVGEMYFIYEGFIGISFSIMSQGALKSNYIISKKQTGVQTVAFHYIVNQ